MTVQSPQRAGPALGPSAFHLGPNTYGKILPIHPHTSPQGIVNGLTGKNLPNTS